MKTQDKLPEAGQHGSKHELSAVAKVEPEAHPYSCHAELVSASFNKDCRRRGVGWAFSPTNLLCWGRNPNLQANKGILKGWIAELTTFARNDGKRAAFTLAEVLITLGVIGIVAAMTIPTLVKNYQKRATITKLKKVYSMLNQITNLAVADYGDTSGWDWQIYGQNISHCQGAVEFSDRYIVPYLNITKRCGCSSVGICNEKLPKRMDGSNDVGIEFHYYFNPARNEVLFLPDGTEITISFAPGSRDIIVDINGISGPNTLGKDIFWFIYNDKREVTVDNRANTYIIPFGYNNPNSAILENCRTWGRYCAAKIMRDGWAIKDDYPW